MQRVELRVIGRVQGVGFRYFVQRTAALLRLSGQVRNLPDGSVEVVAEGGGEDLRALVESVRRGPSGARVAEVVEQWTEGPARHRGFHITP